MTEFSQSSIAGVYSSLLTLNRVVPSNRVDTKAYPGEHYLSNTRGATTSL
jgi:hypothetical protein